MPNDNVFRQTGTKTKGFNLTLKIAESYTHQKALKTPATRGCYLQRIWALPVADEANMGWRRGQKLQALQADRNFWAPQE